MSESTTEFLGALSSIHKPCAAGAGRFVSNSRHTMVFNVAEFLVNQYGDNAKVEIVASGPGVALLFEENRNNECVRGLTQQGVRFYAFRNIHYKVNKMLDEEKPLDPQAQLVQGARVESLNG